jgi:hypothetical protein
VRPACVWGPRCQNGRHFGCVRGCALRVFGCRSVRKGAILGVYVGAPSVCLGAAVSEWAPFWVCTWVRPACVWVPQCQKRCHFGCVRGCALRVFGGRGVRMGAILGVYVGAPCVCLGTAVSERARVGCLGEHHSWCERWDARVCLGERKRGVRSVTG